MVTEFFTLPENANSLRFFQRFGAVRLETYLVSLITLSVGKRAIDINRNFNSTVISHVPRLFV